MNIRKSIELRNKIGQEIFDKYYIVVKNTIVGAKTDTYTNDQMSVTICDDQMSVTICDDEDIDLLVRLYKIYSQYTDEQIDFLCQKGNSLKKYYFHILRLEENNKGNRNEILPKLEEHFKSAF